MAPLLPQTDVMPENISAELTPIQQFYQHKSIFVTGGTGFLGKILIEKLLRTCDLDNVYILVRNKKGKDIHTRIDDLFDDPIFERLKQEQPKFRHKVFPIAGDCALPALGLNPDERLKLQHNVDLVFHVAATTRFDEKLKLALEINVNSTKEVLTLCREMDHLKAVVHVSTAYANCYREIIEEKFYKTNISGESALRLLDCMDEKMLEAVTPILAKDWPNTYTFTKCLAEDLVRATSKGLPIGVFRPAIVIPTYKEPVAGWCDNMFGPTGIVVGCGAGLLRILLIKQDNHAEIVPVDMCVNSLITSAWEIASNTFDDPPIYNYVTSEAKRITWRQYCELSSKHGSKMPMSKGVWYYRFTMTSNKMLANILQFLYHILPALIMDAGLLVVGKKPKMIQIYKKIHRFCDVISYFTHRRWVFHDENTKNLYAKLEQRDKEIYYSDMDTINWDAFIESSMAGLRKYLLKEDPSNIPQAIKRNERMKYLHYITIYTIYTVLLYIVYKIVSSIFFS